MVDIEYIGTHLGGGGGGGAADADDRFKDLQIKYVLTWWTAVSSVLHSPI